MSPRVRRGRAEEMGLDFQLGELFKGLGNFVDLVSQMLDTDILDEGGFLRVVMEMPGIEEKDLKVAVKGDVLEASASRGDRKYNKEVLLPCPVEPSSLGVTYRNGIAEVNLRKA